MGGAALPLELDNLLLVEYFLKQTHKRNPRVCFIGAAHGDADAGRLRFYGGFSQFHCRVGATGQYLAERHFRRRRQHAQHARCVA